MLSRFDFAVKTLLLLVLPALVFMVGAIVDGLLPALILWVVWGHFIVPVCHAEPLSWLLCLGLCSLIQAYRGAEGFLTLLAKTWGES